MDIFVLVSKILGIYLVISGLFLILKTKTVPHLLKDFFGNQAIVFLTGVILIFLSSIFIIQYNVWDGTWKTLITIFAWLTLLKGITYIFFPKSLDWMIKKSDKMFKLWGVVSLIVGVYLYFLG